MALSNRRPTKPVLRQRRFERLGEGELATVVTVHGTYAHIVGPPDAPAPAELQWWQPGSRCEQQMRQLVDAADGQPRLHGVHVERREQRAGAAQGGIGAAEARCASSRSARKAIAWSATATAARSSPAALVESVAKRPAARRPQEMDHGRHAVRGAAQGALPLLAADAAAQGVAGGLADAFDDVPVLPRRASSTTGRLLGRRGNQLLRFAFSAAMMSLPFVVFYTVPEDPRRAQHATPTGRSSLEQAREALRRQMAAAQARGRRGRAGSQAAAAREAAFLRKRLRRADADAGRDLRAAARLSLHRHVADR